MKRHNVGDKVIALNSAPNSKSQPRKKGVYQQGQLIIDQTTRSMHLNKENTKQLIEMLNSLSF